MGKLLNTLKKELYLLEIIGQGERIWNCKLENAKNMIAYNFIYSAVDGKTEMKSM